MTRIRDISIAAAANVLLFTAMALTIQTNIQPARKAVRVDFITIPAPELKTAPSSAVKTKHLPHKKPLAAPVKTTPRPVSKTVEKAPAPVAEVKAPVESRNETSNPAATEPVAPEPAQDKIEPLTTVGQESSPGENEDASEHVETAAPVESGDYLDEKALTTRPGFVTRRAPVYPPMARRMKREGVVVIEAWLEADGKLSDAKVAQSAGYGFDEAALEAVKGSTFSPGMINGRPARAKVSIPYSFVLR